MFGSMQDWPLVVPRILDHAARFHGEREIVTRSIEGPIVRSNYSQIHSGARKVAKALLRHGVKLGDRVATLAWNSGQHLEVWYGIMGIGAICHTVNPRLFPEQIAYIVNHAEDRVIFVDLTFVPILEKLGKQIDCVEMFVVLTDNKNMPQTSLRNAVSYETLLTGVDDDFAWTRFDENTAAGLCYTSGTTGNPKGVLYSHRSNVLHAMAANTSDCVGAKSTDTLMPVVPMFHANAWATTFACPMTGTKLVMPGARLDGPSVYELLDKEKVTITAAVPTVWQMLLTHMEANDLKLPYLRKVLIGGSACPPSMIETFEKKYEVEVMHAWGMTEMSPMGTVGSFKSGMEELAWPEQLKVKTKQGRALFTVELKITDDDGKDLPHDGKKFGHLLVRGPAVAKSYFKGEGGRYGTDSILDQDGWFDTGDIATVDALGFMQITDRAKDVIKSGGEWISSIDVENIAVGCPGVAQAAVIGITHPKWDERPLLVIVRKAGSDVSRDEVLKYLEGKIAKWWTPDDVAFVSEIPLTATGKMQKVALREQFKNYKLPTA
ncbi:MAG: long-chain-fatty-acid--CoA ligase [Micropepsaceae bacterium]